jgi:integrase
LPPAYVSRHFQRLAAAHGLPAIRLHDLRHLSATLGLASGESLKEVSARLGHSSIQITGDIYAQVTPELAHASAERLARHLHAAR